MANGIEQQIEVLEQHLHTHPASPLFARLASYYLETGRTQQALSVCDSGLAHHPFYTTGHLIKGKVLTALGMYAEARRELELVKEFLPFHRTVDELLAAIPESEEATFSPPAPSAFSIPAQETAVVEEPTPIEQPVETERPQEAAETASEEVISPFDQLPAPTPIEEVPQQSSDIFTAESPEDAFSQLQTNGTLGGETAASDPFGMGTETPEEAFGGLEAFRPAETSPPEGEEPRAAEPESPFAALQPEEESPFASLQQEALEATVPAPEEPLAADGAAGEEESFEQYARRMRTELAGSENSINLDEYLGAGVEPAPASAEVAADSTGAEQEAPMQEKKNEIEEIAEKLQNARKITPIINLADKTTHTVTEAETPASTGFVTPTLAEIYAKQGWYDDAIKAYRTLMVTKPAEREKYEKRIQELEELKAQQAGQS